MRFVWLVEGQYAGAASAPVWHSLAIHLFCPKCGRDWAQRLPDGSPEHTVRMVSCANCPPFLRTLETSGVICEAFMREPDFTWDQFPHSILLRDFELMYSAWRTENERNGTDPTLAA